MSILFLKGKDMILNKAHVYVWIIYHEEFYSKFLPAPFPWCWGLWPLPLASGDVKLLIYLNVKYSYVKGKTSVPIYFQIFVAIIIRCFHFISFLFLHHLKISISITAKCHFKYILPFVFHSLGTHHLSFSLKILSSGNQLTLWFIPHTGVHSWNQLPLYHLCEITEALGNWNALVYL